jgi:hypothetical protein
MRRYAIAPGPTVDLTGPRTHGALPNAELDDMCDVRTVDAARRLPRLPALDMSCHAVCARLGTCLSACLPTEQNARAMPDLIRPDTDADVFALPPFATLLGVEAEAQQRTRNVTQ